MGSKRNVTINIKFRRSYLWKFRGYYLESKYICPFH